MGQAYGPEGQPSPRPVQPRLKGDIYSFKKQEENVETADVKADRIFQIIIPSLIAGKVTKIEILKSQIQIKRINCEYYSLNRAYLGY